MIDEDNDESLLSIDSYGGGEQEGERDADSNMIQYISSQKSESNDEKRRKLDSFVLNIHESKRIQQRQLPKQYSNDLIWSVKHIPQKSSDLTLHAKKIKDLATILHDMIYNKTDKRVLVVGGPSGSGKSITVRLLCDEIMNEKRNLRKCALNIEDVSRETNIIEYGYSVNSENSIEHFRDFLEECKILTGVNEKCVIIEELPNIYHKPTNQNFQESLLKWIETSRSINLPPLILCITEYDIENDHKSSFFNIDNTFKVETVLGYKIMEYENIAWQRITFNPVAKTFIKKSLMNIIAKENIKMDKDLKQLIEDICQLGDLRNAINVFEYYTKFMRGIENATDMLSKESGLNMFHSIGKLIYGSKHQEDELLNFRKRMNLNSLLTGETVDTYSSDLITSQLISEDITNSLTKVNLCSLENYKLNCDEQVNEKLSEMINNWSYVDSVSDTTNNDILGNLAFYSCLNTRIHIAGKSTTGHHKMIFSRDSKASKARRLIKLEISGYLDRRRTRLLRKPNQYNYLSGYSAILYDGFYQAQIMGSFKERQRRYTKGLKILDVHRLGGNFNRGLQPENEFKVLDFKAIEEEYYGKVGQFTPEEDDSEYLTDESLELTEDEAIAKPENVWPDDTFSDDDM